MHDFWMWVFSIPLVAIIGGLLTGIIQMFVKSSERRMEMRLQMQQGKNEEVSHQLQAIRAEIASLRDTSTQFDVSLEHGVQRQEEFVRRLEERIKRLETRGLAPSAIAATPDEPQQVGLR